MPYYDEFFRDTDSYFKKLTQRMFREMNEIENAIKSGKLKGEWDIKPIKEPGVKGYVAQGRFQLGEPLRLPKRAIDEVREPLADVFEDKDHVKLYIELPGVEKDDIQLNTTETQVEVKAKNFYKNINLPTTDIESDKVSANYKNGVLEVTIPKTKKTAKEEKKKTIKID
jgi:HSP20 family protein